MMNGWKTWWEQQRGEIVIVIFLDWADREEEGGVLVVGWWVVLWSEAFAEQG